MKAIVNTVDLKNAINSIKICVSKDAMRPVYNNIKLELRDKKVRVVSCDGFRLAYAEVSAELTGKGEAIIPLFSIPKYAEEKTNITVSNKYTTIDFGIYKITYKNNTGTYLDYEFLFNKREKEYNIGFDATLLKQVLGSFKNSKIELKFDAVDNKNAVVISDIEDKSKKAVVLPYKLREE